MNGAGVRRVMRLVVCVAVALATTLLASPAWATAAKVQDTLAQRMMACTVCHGDQGRAGPDGYYPRIAGKPAGYLYHQLLNFRDGQRHYGLMARLLEPLSDDYLMEMARHFAALDLPYPPPAAAAGVDARTLQRGEQLALRGDAARQVPACAACHGKALMGVQPATPALLGLPRDYLNSQLGAWHSGQRKAHAPDCMAQIVQRLTLADLNAVASWLAAQPVPRPSRAAATLPEPAPMRCGSVLGEDPARSAATTRPSPTPSTPASALASASASATASTPSAAPSTAPSSTTAGASPVERGAYLARAGNCMACHTARGGAPWAGGRGIETPFGTVVAGNLTPDPATGIGRWSADDFWRAMREGRSRDGRLLYPAFPYTSYSGITREDSDALFAYLKSLPAVTQENRPHALRWPYGTQAALWAWRTLYFKPQRIEPDPRRSAEWNRGAYLVRTLGHCAECHAPRNRWGALQDAPALRGGHMPVQRWYAPSLADPREAAVHDWTLQDTVTLLRTGRNAHASVMGPMAEAVLHGTQHLSEADLRAMATYLRELPRADPLPTRAIAATAVSTELRQLGAAHYEKHCAQCHGDRGQGVAGIYPRLAGNRAVTHADPSNLLQVVLHGGFAPATAAQPRPFGMPPYVLQFNDTDLAAVLTHIRTQWGHQAAPVTALQVRQLREAETR